jgi:hypothetical protein
MHNRMKHDWVSFCYSPALESHRVQIGRKCIDPPEQLRPRQAAFAVAQRTGIGPGARMPLKQRVKSIRTPHAARIVLASDVRIMQSRYRAHLGSAVQSGATQACVIISVTERVRVRLAPVAKRGAQFVRFVGIKVEPQQ